MYLPHSYFVTDHKQAWREDPTVGLAPGEVPIRDDGTPARAWAIEEDKRWKMRKQIFPNIRDDTVIFANWNQLYKVSRLLARRSSLAHPSSPADRPLHLPHLAQHSSETSQLDPVAAPLPCTRRSAPQGDGVAVGWPGSR